MKVNIRNYNRGPSERKIEIQIDPWDTYSLDYTVALIVLPMLLQLKGTKQGVPNELTTRVGGDMDNNFCFDFINEDDDEVFNKLCANWDDILDKMIWSFQQLVDDSYDSKYHHGNVDVEWKLSPFKYPNPITGVMEETYEMVDKNPTSHWYDQVGHMLHEQRIQEGLELFGKYYRSLWD